MPTKHVATLLGATCCVRLATVLRHVGCYWLKFDHFQIWANNTQHVATHRNTVAKSTQHVAPNNVATCCVGMLRSFGRGLRTFWVGLIVQERGASVWFPISGMTKWFYLFQESFARVEWRGNSGEIQSTRPTQLSSFSNYKLQDSLKLPHVELQVTDLSTQVPVEQTKGGCFE